MNRPYGPEAGTLTGKSIGGKRMAAADPDVFPQREAGPSVSTNSEFGVRNSDLESETLCLPIRHSAFYIPHWECPPGPGREGCLMVFSRHVLTSGPRNAGHFSLALTT